MSAPPEPFYEQQGKPTEGSEIVLAGRERAEEAPSTSVQISSPAGCAR
jgi:hypothetical protein